MLKAIGNLLDRLSLKPGQESGVSREHAVRLATALLLVEVARADYNEDLTENVAILGLVKGFFELADDEASALVEQARAESDKVASLQSFTRQLNEELSLDEKRGVVEMLWRVAMADDHLDKHEDHLVRKVAGLLYVSHSDLIRIRNRVKNI